MADGLVVRITPEFRETLCEQLAHCHGPLNGLPEVGTVSITTAGNSCLESLRKAPANYHLTTIVDFSVELSSHIQVFTSTVELARQFVHLPGVTSPTPVIAPRVALTPSTDLFSGYLLDVVDRGESAHVASTTIRRCFESWASTLAAHFGRQPSDVSARYQLSPLECSAIVLLSGWFGGSRGSIEGLRDTPVFQGQADTIGGRLEQIGILRRKNKSDARNAARHRDPENALVMDYGHGSRVLTSLGEEVLQMLLDHVPDWTRHVIGARRVSEQYFLYFEAEERATEAREICEQHHIHTSEIEGIGGWCIDWWNPQESGYRFAAHAFCRPGRGRAAIEFPGVLRPLQP